MGFSDDFSAMNKMVENAKTIDDKLGSSADAYPSSEYIESIVSLGEIVCPAYESAKRCRKDKETSSIRMMAQRVAKTGIGKKYDRALAKASKRIGNEFSRQYSSCNSMNKGMLESQREKLDEICARHSALMQASPVKKSPSSIRNSRIEAYSSFRDMIKDVDKRADELCKAYQNEAPRTKEEAKRLLEAAEAISRSYKRALAKHIPSTKVWWINPHKAYGFEEKTKQVREELCNIVKNYETIISEVGQIRSEKRKAASIVEYIKNIPKDADPKEVLVLLSGKNSSLGESCVKSYTPFRKEWEDCLEAINKANNSVDSKKKEAVGIVINRIKDSYSRVEAFLGTGISKEGYKIEIEKAKNSLEQAMSSIKTLEEHSNTDLSAQKRRYSELRSAVKSMESAFYECKNEKESRRKLEEKRLEIERERTAKRHEIAVMELEQSRRNYSAAKEGQRAAESMERRKFSQSRDERFHLYAKESPKAVSFGSVDGSTYFNLPLHIRRLGFNDNYKQVARAASKPENGIQAVENITEALGTLTSAGNAALDREDLQYIESFYNCVKESLRRGQFARLRTRENEPKIEVMLDAFEEYISIIRERMPKNQTNPETIPVSLQYSTAG